MAGESVDQGILMTDLEGSTAHLRALGDEYADVLAQHHAIIRHAFEKEAGLEVGSEGDSFAVVFPGTVRALRAAVTMQRALLDAAWPDSPWRVRIAIHSGPVEQGEAGAVGLSLHEAARIRAVVHGGQVVVSEAARSAIDEPVAAEIGLTDLGLHKVRDFDSPVRLHQLSAPGLPSSFPPLRTMTSRDVPQPRTPFVGRGAELAELLELLSNARLVTITGAGGSGKTRLAYEVARRAEIETLTVVELAGLRDETQVDAEVGRAVGARQPDEIESSIGAREMLLVVDNCEHVMPRIALLVSELLERCDGLVVLATSRQPLGVTGEVVWPAPQLDPTEAIDLFRARAASSTDDSDLVRTACERLGCMPLAIELAAARVRSVPLDSLVKRLDDQLGLLTTGVRDTPRQQTMRATLDWSHELLTPEERVVFRRLAVFAGGFTVDAAEAVVVDGPDVHFIDALDGLVLKSLVEFSPDTGRYRMLEPVRQYGTEQLESTTEAQLIHERHLRWALAVAREGNAKLFTAEQRQWTSKLAVERGNFGAALGWAIHNDQLTAATTVAASLAWFWFISDRNEGFAWTPRIMEALDSLDDLHRARALLVGGITYCDFAGDARPIDWLLEAEAICRELGRERALSGVLFWLGRAAAARGQMDLAERVFTESLDIHSRLGDMFGWGWSKTWLGLIARERDQLELAEQIQYEVLARCEGVLHVEGAAYGALAQLAAMHGNIEKALDHNERALQIYRDLGDQWQVAIVLSNRAGITAGTSSALTAACTLEALRRFREIGSDPDIEHALLSAACLLHEAGRGEEAAVIGGAAREPEPSDMRRWPEAARKGVEHLLTVLAEPEWRLSVARGRRLGARDAADAAIEWVERAYPTSASISV